MSDHDQVFCTKLAKAVKRHPCLYNFNLPEYSNKIALEKAWEIVAKDTGMSVLNCKDKWRNIRTVFSRNLKRGRSGEIKKRPYYLKEVLKFLVPYVKASNFNSPKKIFDEESGTSSQLCRLKDETREANKDTISAKPKSSDKSSSSNGLVPNGATLSAATSVQSQPLLLVVKPKETSDIGKTEKPKNEACSEFCIKHTDVDITDSHRKMFLLSLLSDVENMTDLQFRKFRLDALSMIDNILLSSSDAQIMPNGGKTSNVKVEMEVQYDDVEAFRELSDDSSVFAESVKIESVEIEEEMIMS